MQRATLLRSVPVVLALGASLAGIGSTAAAAGAATAHSAMKVTDTGKLTKIVSMTSFDIKVGSKTYLVTTNDMTKITLDMKSVKVGKLKVGDTITAKGTLDMETITATSISASM